VPITADIKKKFFQCPVFDLENVVKGHKGSTFTMIRKDIEKVQTMKTSKLQLKDVMNLNTFSPLEKKLTHFNTFSVQTSRTHHAIT
jgi:hypothetical protein